MTQIPRMRKALSWRDDPKHGGYDQRWRWYYDSIADWMIANPGGTFIECGKKLGKHPNTIGHIIKSDMFQEYLAQRKQEWQRNHDYAILSRTTAVAEKALDVLLEKLEKQSDKIPLQLINEVATNALDRLGYAPKTGAQVQVNVDNSKSSSQVVMVPISAEALEEARDAIRVAEQQRTIEARVAQPELVESDAEPGEAESSSPDAAPTLDDVS